jgi:hypothetical protein
MTMPTSTAGDYDTGPARQAWPRRSVAAPAALPTVEALASDDWDALLSGFDDASYEQSAAFVSGRWGVARTRCLVVRVDGETVGGACCPLLRVPMLGRGFAYLKFGPVWRRDGSPADAASYRAVVTALCRHFRAREGLGTVVLPRPHPSWLAVETGVLRELGWRVQRAPVDPNRYLVDLRMSDAALKRNLSQKWRYNLRKAEATGLDVREVEVAKGRDAFGRLHAELVDRKRHHDTDSIELLPGIARSLPTPLRPRLFTAMHAGTPVAAAIVAACGDTAYYLFGASSKQALALRAGYALQWFIVNELRRGRSLWYDLGGEAGSDGLRQFKAGLVGSSGAVVVMPGEFRNTPDLLNELATNSIFGLQAARRRVREWVR